MTRSCGVPFSLMPGGRLCRFTSYRPKSVCASRACTGKVDGDYPSRSLRRLGSLPFRNPRPGHNLLKCADAALSQAKRDGRDALSWPRRPKIRRDHNLATIRDLVFCIFTTSDTTKLHAFLARPC